jgi:hypothetical protein
VWQLLTHVARSLSPGSGKGEDGRTRKGEFSPAYFPRRHEHWVFIVMEWRRPLSDRRRYQCCIGVRRSHRLGRSRAPRRRTTRSSGAPSTRPFERTRQCGPRQRSSLRSVQRPSGREDQDDVRISPARVSYALRVVVQPEHPSDTQSSAGESRPVCGCQPFCILSCRPRFRFFLLRALFYVPDFPSKSGVGPGPAASGASTSPPTSPRAANSAAT